MEESKLDRFKSGTKKLFGRTNERLKQKMGRSSDPISKDDKWQVHVANFNRQQAAGLKLHREVKGYIASLKTLESSTQTLLDAIREMHEYTWPGNMSLVKALQGLDKLTKEHSVTMVDSILVPVNNYIEVFPDIKERMHKRERKLLDYTRCKRNLDALKKGDKISTEKLGFAQDEFSENKMIYEELNNELCEDLPEFWNSRKPFITKFLDGFFKKNLEFHQEFAQVHSETYAALDPLKEALRNEPPSYKEIGETDKYFVVSDNARKFKRQSLRRSFRKSGGGFKRSMSLGAMGRKNKREKDAPQSVSNLSVDPNPYIVPAQQAQPYTPTKSTPNKASPPRPKPPRSPRQAVNEDLEKELANDSSATPFSPSIKVEPGTIVECIHEYKAVDEDELTFVAGDVVTVVPWDSTDEQDEGWFMGVIQGSGAKGAFPINYTRKHNTLNNCDKAVNEYDAVPEEPAEDEAFETIDLGETSSDAAPARRNEYMNIPGDDPVEENTVTNGNLDTDSLPDNNANHVTPPPDHVTTDNAEKKQSNVEYVNLGPDIDDEPPESDHEVGDEEEEGAVAAAVQEEEENNTADAEPDNGAEEGKRDVLI